jgi:PIN domain nuclease of toxin-antitoxin system
VRLLLDTQVALWWLTASPRLAKSSRGLMVSSSCAVSVASIWEVDLKHRLGKLPITPLRCRDEMRSAGATISR